MKNKEQQTQEDLDESLSDGLICIVGRIELLKEILTFALDVVLYEVSGVSAIIGPGEASVTVLLALLVVALVAGTIGPRLEPFTVLLVFLPVALVPCAVEMAVDSVAVSFVILPRPVVDITISVDQSSLSVGFAVSPVAFVHGAIRPDLRTLALADTLVFRGGSGTDQPFALILSSILKLHHSTFFFLAKLLLELEVVVDKGSQLGSHSLETIKVED